MPGLPYLVGERDAEIFVPGVAGSILPTRVMKAAMAATVMATPSFAMPTSAEIEQRIDPRPALAKPAPATQVHREGDTISIHIAPPPGTDEETIARLVMRELNRRDNERRADLHDGVDY